MDLSAHDFRAWYGLGQAYELLKMPFYALYYYRCEHVLAALLCCLCYHGQLCLVLDFLDCTAAGACTCCFTLYSYWIATGFVAAPLL